MARTIVTTNEEEAISKEFQRAKRILKCRQLSNFDSPVNGSE